MILRQGVAALLHRTGHRGVAAPATDPVTADVAPIDRSTQGGESVDDRRSRHLAGFLSSGCRVEGVTLATFGERCDDLLRVTEDLSVAEMKASGQGQWELVHRARMMYGAVKEHLAAPERFGLLLGLDSGGRVVGALSYYREAQQYGGHFRVNNLGTAMGSRHVGVALMAAMCQEAAGAGTGVVLEAATGSDGFYFKLGMDRRVASNAHSYWYSEDAAKRVAVATPDLGRQSREDRVEDLVRVLERPAGTEWDRGRD